MNGFAFAAIYKEPDTPGPGPHIDGPVIDDEDEKEKDNTTYTISGTSITPFVPFTVTVTASNSKGKGNGGHLQSSFSYEVISDGGKWESGTTHTWNLFTRVCDKNIQTAEFAWLISGRTPVRTTLNYNCGSMTPAISGAVIIGKTFNFSITFSGHGEDCLARNLSDFGATYWWEARKNNTWERTNRIAVNQTPSFSQGVLSGVAHVGNLVGYDRIRLCVSYAGLATAYAEAAITSAAVTITLGDDSLHVWGPSTTLKIESESLQYMTAEFKRNGNATQDITDTNGDPIAFNFTGTSWTGNIQAATGATAGTVVLKVMYNGVVQATQEITVETELLADITVSAGSILQGDTFDMTGSVSSTLGELARIPANAFSLVAVQNNSPLASISNTAGSQDVEYEGVTPTNYGTIYVRIIDNRDDSIIAEEEVTVQSIYEALAEAINERNKAKGNPTSYTGQEQASQLASYTRSAMYDYIKESDTDFTTNSIVSYTSSNGGNTGISTTQLEGMTEAQWMRDCYNKICTARKKALTNNNSLTRISWRKEVSEYEDQTMDDVDGQYVYEDISNTIARAKNKALSSWSGDFSEYSSVNQSICGLAHIYISSHRVYASLRQNKIQLRLNALPTVACTVNIYSGIAKYDSDTTFNKLGANIADEGKYGIIGHYEQDTNELIMSPIVIDASVSFSNNTGTSGSAYGFQGGNTPVVLDYHFKHK